MSELLGMSKDRKEALKGLIKRLHEGADPDEIKREFKELFGSITPIEIAQIEEELIREGMPAERIRELCDVHLAVFQESLQEEKPLAPPGHPIHILMAEHEEIVKIADELKNISQKVKQADGFDSVNKEIERMKEIAELMKASESHYLREENVLFPYLEKHGITQPPAIMWTEHDNIRNLKKRFYNLVETYKDLSFQDFAKRLEGVSLFLIETLVNHFYKENKILFPTALEVIEKGEWGEIRRQFDELGYPPFTPKSAVQKFEVVEAPAKKPEKGEEGEIVFETGSLSREQLEAILNTLPVDITFIDAEDTVRYFNQAKDRIFARTKAVIGRKVQQCHPRKSIHIVNKILEDFKSKRRDVAEFWINFKGRLVHIRYFAVRNKQGEYIGTIEVTQDITDIKKLEGEKRIYDELA